MNILIYAPVSRNRSPDQQAQAELLIRMGHKVILLTWSPDGVLHNNFRALGATAYSSVHKKGRSVFFFIRQAFYLISFCKKHHVDIVFSHLQGNALVAGLARPFLKARLFYFRHNADYFSLKGSKKDNWINNMVNKLSPSIIAISENVRTELIKEGVPQHKIIRINLCYNFDKYLLDEITGQAPFIRQQSGGAFVVLCIARLDVLKRHVLLFEAVQQVNVKGFDCSLVCIGDGDKRPELEGWIRDNKMESKIQLYGVVENVSDYILAADIQVLLSYSEASNQAIKEGAFFKRTAIVCKGVGDFEDYIVNGENGFIVDKENPVLETAKYLQQFITDKGLSEKLGINLCNTVTEKFGLENVLPEYQKILGS